MGEDLSAASRRYAVDIRATNRALLEKALHMRCLAYLAKAKASLLTQTIVEVNRAKKSLQHSYEQLSDEQRIILRQKAELEAANEALRSFSFAVSHDLRAPLRGLEGLAEILAHDYTERLDPRGRDLLVRLRSTARRMSDLISAMLDLTRVARSEPRRERVDLSALAEEIVAELCQLGPERDVTVQIEPGLVVEADRGLTQSLLQNLLGNAWKYTGPVPQARISLAAAELEGRPAFEVRDNGVGFDRSAATRLFTPFARMHGDKEFPGLGVGLATAKRIVERHGGALVVESAPGAGTRVVFALQPGAAPAHRPA